MFFVLYKFIILNIKKRAKTRVEIKKELNKKSEKMKNYLSNSPEMNFSTFSYASSSVY